MNDRKVGVFEDSARVVDELTPTGATGSRHLKRRLSWRRRLAAAVPAAALPAIMAVGVIGATGATGGQNLVSAATAGSETRWAVRVCPEGDCTRPASTLSPRQFATSSVVLSGPPPAASRKTQVTVTVQTANSGATANGTAIRTVIVRAHHAVNTPLATLPSLFAETGAVMRVATTYTITVHAQGAIVGSAAVTLTR